MRNVEMFLDTYKNSTKKTYKSAITKYFTCISGVEIKGNRPNETERNQIFDLADKYIGDKSRNYYEDMMKFASYLENVPPKSAITYIAAVKEFLSHNDIEFTQRELKTIHLKLPKGGSARTVEMDMDKNVLKQLLEHMDLKFTALMLVLSSSGMRIGEALQIHIEDIDMDTTPTTVNIRGEYTKNGSKRLTFISKEAKTSLIEWYKVRDKYLSSSVNKNNGLRNAGIGNKKDINDERVFPFSYAIVRNMWTNVLEKSELLKVDRGTGRTQLRIHQLRKYFRSQLAMGCPVDIVEALMGHEGYLSDAYRRYTKKQMADEYLKYEHLLYISVPKDLQKIESEFKGELNTSRKILEQLIVEKTELTKQANELTEQVKEIKRENAILQNHIERMEPINISEQIEDAVVDLVADNEIYKNEIKELQKEITILYEMVRENISKQK